MIDQPLFRILLICAGIAVFLCVWATLVALLSWVGRKNREIRAREDELQYALNVIRRFQAREIEWWKANAAILGRWQEEKDLRVKIEQGFERYQMEHPHEGKAN
jgi:hypothetical protein